MSIMGPMTYLVTGTHLPAQSRACSGLVKNVEATCHGDSAMTLREAMACRSCHWQQE